MHVYTCLQGYVYIISYLIIFLLLLWICTYICVLLLYTHITSCVFISVLFTWIHTFTYKSTYTCIISYITSPTIFIWIYHIHLYMHILVYINLYVYIYIYTECHRPIYCICILCTWICAFMYTSTEYHTLLFLNCFTPRVCTYACIDLKRWNRVEVHCVLRRKLLRVMLYRLWS